MGSRRRIRDPLRVPSCPRWGNRASTAPECFAPRSTFPGVALPRSVSFDGALKRRHPIHRGGWPTSAQSAVARGPTRLTAWVRDYHLSVVLLVAGIVLAVGVTAAGVRANSTGNYTFWPGLAITVIGSAGFGLILVAGTVAYYHGWGLRQSRRSV